MYTPLKSYQVIISLLKQNNIRHLVLSAGTRNIPFVQSVENDPYFDCYSVVDERSAAYMALGMSLRLNEPVVISCTSSTATCNYFPAIAEAFHQGAQLIVLTSDRNPALLNQREDQMIDQVGMYGKFVKKCVNLPIVNTDEDLWFCERLVNEAILATYQHGRGPVQINIPMLSYYSRCNEPNILTARKIDLCSYETPADEWKKCADILNGKKRIMVICGQNNYTSPEFNSLLKEFGKKYKNVLLAEYMANIEVEDAINPFLPFDTNTLSSNAFNEFLPEIVISLGTNVMSGIKAQLRQKAGLFEHWGVEESGNVVDMYKSLTKVFECSPEYFLRYFIDHVNDEAKDTVYLDEVKKYVGNIKLPELPYSNNTVIQQMAARIPDGSILHLSINNSIRIINYCGLPNRTIKVYANIGTHGIDGCLSSFIGQAVTSDKLSFLIIGDLSFFYDMGAMRIRHIPKTARILMINNYGGGEFHYSTTLAIDPTMDLHTSAAHKTEAQGWVESVGFKYYAVHNEVELKTALDAFFDSDSDKPIFIEAFSDMEIDATNTHKMERYNREETTTEEIKRVAKEKIVNAVGYKTIDKVIHMLK